MISIGNNVNMLMQYMKRIMHAQFTLNEIFHKDQVKIKKQLILSISKHIYLYKLIIITLSYLHLLSVLIVINYTHFPD